MSECSEVELMATRVLIDRRFCADTYHKKLAEAVLALTAENKTLTKIFADAPNLPDTDVEWLEKTRVLEAERDQLKAETNRLQSAANTLARIGYKDHDGELWKPPMGKAPDFNLIDRLKAENEALRKDAERYRWLRESSQYDWDVSYGKLELRIATPHVDSSDLDACIDAAIAHGDQP